jgi:hypothetical protein
MRFLRMLTNSLLAGALGAAYLTVLVLQLNPQIPLVSGTTWRWFATLGLLHGLHLAVTFYVVIVVRELFALDGLSPGWASVRVLAWMAAAAAAVASVLMWLNLHGFTAALTDAASRRMTNGALATSLSAVLLLAIAIAHYSFGRRGSRVGASLFVLAAVASIALPLAARGDAVPSPPGNAVPSPPGDVVQSSPGDVVPSPPESGVTRAAVHVDDLPGPGVRLILLDGASLEYILPRVAEGRLPNFARLLDKGARMDLATVRPTQPDTVWASVATGMYPSKNGVRSAGLYYAKSDDRGVDLLPDYCLAHALVRLGFVRDEPLTSSAWRARPLWEILSDAGISVGIVRWPLTYPAPPVHGFVVSDRFHQLVGSISAFDRAAYPPEALQLLQEAVATSRLSDPAARAGSEPRATQPPEVSAMDRDRLYTRAMQALVASGRPRFTALRYDGLDTVGHYYLRYAQPRLVRGVPEEERRRFWQVVDHYYTYIDGEIGASMDSLASGDLLVVISGFGMQPLNPVKRALGRLLGDPDFSGTHERAPDGFLLAYGAAADPGRRRRGSLVDVAPTLLYFLGLPVARDMDGFARADLFSRAFKEERPIVFIPSYASGDRR